MSLPGRRTSPADLQGLYLKHTSIPPVAGSVTLPSPLTNPAAFGAALAAQFAARAAAPPVAAAAADAPAPITLSYISRIQLYLPFCSTPDLLPTYPNVPSRLMGRVCIALKQEMSVSRATRPNSVHTPLEHTLDAMR